MSKPLMSHKASCIHDAEASGDGWFCDAACPVAEFKKLEEANNAMQREIDSIKVNRVAAFRLAAEQQRRELLEKELAELKRGFR